MHRVRLSRDYYVRIDSNDYSVDPRAIGRFVDSPLRKPPSPFDSIATSLLNTNGVGQRNK